VTVQAKIATSRQLTTIRPPHISRSSLAVR